MRDAVTRAIEDWCDDNPEVADFPDTHTTKDDNGVKYTGTTAQDAADFIASIQASADHVKFNSFLWMLAVKYIWTPDSYMSTIDDYDYTLSQGYYLIVPESHYSSIIYAAVGGSDVTITPKTVSPYIVKQVKDDSDSSEFTDLNVLGRDSGDEETEEQAHGALVTNERAASQAGQYLDYRITAVLPDDLVSWDTFPLVINDRAEGLDLDKDSVNIFAECEKIEDSGNIKTVKEKYYGNFSFDVGAERRSNNDNLSNYDFDLFSVRFPNVVEQFHDSVNPRIVIEYRAKINPEKQYQYFYRNRSGSVRYEHMPKTLQEFLDSVHYEVKEDYKGNLEGSYYFGDDTATAFDDIGLRQYQNDAQMLYPSNVYENKEPKRDFDNTLVKTRLLTIRKTDANTGKELTGAEFTIQAVEPDDEASKGLYVQKDGSLGKEPYRFTTNRYGCVAVLGLDDGKYLVKEVKAPEGYDIDSQNEIVCKADRDVVFSDTKRLSLPLTGRKGIVISIATGVTLILASAVVIAKRKKKEAEV